MDNFKNSVIKFGGSSVAIHYKKIKEIVKKTKPRFIVVSAPGKKKFK